MGLSTLDQSLPKPEDRKKQVLQTVNDAIDKADNVEEALSIAEQLIIISDLSGLALAQTFYKIHKKFKVDSDYIYQRVGKTKETVDKYIRVWSLFAEDIMPPELHDAMQDRNIKELIPIGNAYHQGYEIHDKDWKQLSIAPDFNTVSKYVREKIKEKPPRKSSLRIYVKRNGDIIAFKGESKPKFVGRLDLTSNSDVVKMARNRIIKNSGMMRQQ